MNLIHLIAQGSQPMSVNQTMTMWAAIAAGAFLLVPWPKLKEIWESDPNQKKKKVPKPDVPAPEKEVPVTDPAEMLTFTLSEEEQELVIYYLTSIASAAPRGSFKIWWEYANAGLSIPEIMSHESKLAWRDQPETEEVPDE